MNTDAMRRELERLCYPVQDGMTTWEIIGLLLAAGKTETKNEGREEREREREEWEWERKDREKQ